MGWLAGEASHHRQRNGRSREDPFYSHYVRTHLKAHLATQEGNRDSLVEALRQGVSARTVFPGSDGISFLGKSVVAGDYDLVAAMLDNDPWAAWPTVGIGPVAYAVFLDEPRMVEILLRMDADPNEGYYFNALEIACRRGDAKLVELLLEHWADVFSMSGGRWKRTRFILEWQSFSTDVQKVLARHMIAHERKVLEVVGRLMALHEGAIED